MQRCQRARYGGKRHFGTEQHLSMAHGCVTPIKINIEAKNLFIILPLGPVLWRDLTQIRTATGTAGEIEHVAFLSLVLSTVYLCAPSKT